MSVALLLSPRFTEAELLAAHETWGCNCGPAALAFAVGLTLDAVRPLVEREGFAGRRYMNPQMMSNAIWNAGFAVRSWGKAWPTIGVALVRIQWGGPWIIRGKATKWAYTHTHWIAAFRDAGSWLHVYDVNGGRQALANWEMTTAPKIIRSIPRADGSWSVTHSWGLKAPDA